MSLRIKLFCHSIVSDWNHGNAHFLRGILTEFAARGHDVESLEQTGNWSRSNLEADHGAQVVSDFTARYPTIRWRSYADVEAVESAIGDADLILVHEWNSPELIKAVGDHRRTHRNARVFFHDTHHRAITAPAEMRLNELVEYDGILVYGQTLKDAYARLGWSSGIHVWHEAADTRVFKPLLRASDANGLVWVGNWGDDERTEELQEFLFEPVASLGMPANIYGVRYPADAVERLRKSGISYRGWLANYRAPEVFAQHRFTVHVPRRPYVTALPGIPTIRPFEAMACGIPLLCSPWHDSEALFHKGEDYLEARNGAEMKNLMAEVVSDAKLAAALAKNGLRTILNRHTCTHRVDELMAIYRQVAPSDVAAKLNEMCEAPQ